MSEHSSTRRGRRTVVGVTAAGCGFPAVNLNAGTWGIGDDADLLVTPVVQSRTTLCENDYCDEVPEVHAIRSFTRGNDAINLPSMLTRGEDRCIPIMGRRRS